MSISALETFLLDHFRRRSSELLNDSGILAEAVVYSLHSGGKRFRPKLAFATAELLGVSQDRVVPHAAAVEMIHTYSLIHDDLPAMDDDTFRRGQITNHIKFGEANALLAGDALLTEAFFVLGEQYRDVPELGLELTRLLAEAAGFTGMVAGQVADLRFADGEPVSGESLLAMHRQKTGALIRYSSEGVAVLARSSPTDRKAIRQLGENIGLAFQIADDLLDYDPNAVEKNGLPAHVGLEKTREMLAKLTAECQQILKPFGARGGAMAALIAQNQSRKI